MISAETYNHDYELAYKQGRAYERTRILALADCEDKECWDCPFGRAEGCVLKESK